MGARKEAAVCRGRFPRSFLMRVSCLEAGSVARAIAAFHPFASSCSSTVWDLRSTSMIELNYALYCVELIFPVGYIYICMYVYPLGRLDDDVIDGQ